MVQVLIGIAGIAMVPLAFWFRVAGRAMEQASESGDIPPEVQASLTRGLPSAKRAPALILTQGVVFMAAGLNDWVYQEFLPAEAGIALLLSSVRTLKKPEPSTWKARWDAARDITLPTDQVTLHFPDAPGRYVMVTGDLGEEPDEQLEEDLEHVESLGMSDPRVEQVQSEWWVIGDPEFMAWYAVHGPSAVERVPAGIAWEGNLDAEGHIQNITSRRVDVIPLPTAELRRGIETIWTVVPKPVRAAIQFAIGACALASVIPSRIRAEAASFRDSALSGLDTAFFGFGLLVLVIQLLRGRLKAFVIYASAYILLLLLARASGCDVGVPGP